MKSWIILNASKETNSTKSSQQQQHIVPTYCIHKNSNNDGLTITASELKNSFTKGKLTSFNAKWEEEKKT